MGWCGDVVVPNCVLVVLSSCGEPCRHAAFSCRGRLVGVVFSSCCFFFSFVFVIFCVCVWFVGGGRRRACVRSKRHRVCRHHAHMLKNMWTWCPCTRRRFECAHGSVSESTHVFFHFFQCLAHHTHTTTTNNTTTQRHTPHTTTHNITRRHTPHDVISTHTPHTPHTPQCICTVT